MDLGLDSLSKFSLLDLMVTDSDVSVFRVASLVSSGLDVDFPLSNETEDRLARIISIIMDLQSQHILIWGPE